MALRAGNVKCGTWNGGEDTILSQSCTYRCRKASQARNNDEDRGLWMVGCGIVGTTRALSENRKKHQLPDLCRQRTRHALSLHHSPSHLPSHLSPLTSSLSPLPYHLSPLTSHLSPLPSHLFPLTSSLSPLPSHLSPLTSSLSPLPPILSTLYSVIISHRSRKKCIFREAKSEKKCIFCLLFRGKSVFLRC